MNRLSNSDKQTVNMLFAYHCCSVYSCVFNWQTTTEWFNLCNSYQNATSRSLFFTFTHITAFQF